MNKYRIGGLR